MARRGGIPVAIDPSAAVPSRRARAVSIALCCCAVYSAAITLAPPQAAWAAQRAPVADAGDLRQLRARIERLKSALAEGEESRAEARDALRESERAISESNRQLRELGEERQAARAELAQLRGESRRIEAALAQRQEALGTLLSMRYVRGEGDYLKLLLSGIDPNQTARELHYYGYVTRAHADMIRSLRAALARMKALEQETREKTAELARIESGQKLQRNRLSREQAARRGVLEKVSARIREQRRQVRGLERDESRLTRLVEELGRVLADEAQRLRPGLRESRRNDAVPSADGTLGSRSFASLRGRLRLPIRGELASRFGNPRPDGGPSWKGLFIRSPSGQDVRAVAPGRVVFAEWMRGFGNLLILDHGEGYLTIYGNNEAVLKQVGDAVGAGDAVATTGSSGGSPESGLYFEMRHEGRPFDPLKWVVLK